MAGKTTATKSKSAKAKRLKSTISEEKPLLFISHDTRDAEIAKAFGELIHRSSSGVIQTFRSSDTEGVSGIPYGDEWYRHITERLDQASNIVALLTPQSNERPWILYECGYGKGRKDITVFGLAFGVSRSKIAGPFKELQNSDDSKTSLVKLVKELLKRNTDLEAIDDLIQQHVDEFKEKIDRLVPRYDIDPDEQKQNDVINLFQEVRFMFQDLSMKLDRERTVKFVDSSELDKRASIVSQLFHFAATFSQAEIEQLGSILGGIAQNVVTGDGSVKVYYHQKFDQITTKWMRSDQTAAERMSELNRKLDEIIRSKQD